MAFIQVRIDEKEKEQAQKVFENMGMSTSGAIKLFIRKTIQEQKLPFEVTASLKKKKEKKEEEKLESKFTNFVRKSF